MKVKLIKEAEYELNEEKSTKVPFGTFCKMSAVDIDLCHDNSYPKVRIFSDINEFRNAENFVLYDNTKDVYILSNGQFCVFLKEKEEILPTLEKTKNESTNSKENTIKKS